MMHIARSFFRVTAPVFFIAFAFVCLSSRVDAAANYCKWRCIRFQAASPSCQAAQTATGRDIGTHLATWVFGNDQHFTFPDASSCTADSCLHKCQEACPTGNTSSAFEGAIAEVGGNYCIVESLGPAALPLSECISGAMVWDRPSCIEPPAGSDTGSGSTGSAPAACREATPTPTQQQTTGQSRGTCSFSCIHPGEQRTVDLPHVVEHASSVPGSGTTQVRGSLAPGPGESVSCQEATFEQRTGSSCTPGGHCDCEQQCVSACGSDTHGKSYCFLGADDPRQVAICATSAAQGHAPTCGNGSPTALTNPLGTTSISELIARLIRAITGIAGSMALLMFVVGGVMWMTAEGSDRVGTAQTILKNATIGLALTFLSYSIVSLFLSVLGL